MKFKVMLERQLVVEGSDK